MDKTVAGVLGALTVLATQAHAAPAQPPSFDAAMQVESYADLLRPIPNAVALLAVVPEPSPTVQTVQYYDHHHHHHHHRYYRRRRYHHHHHHDSYD
jgi:hypothetical protein